MKDIEKNYGHRNGEKKSDYDEIKQLKSYVRWEKEQIAKVDFKYGVQQLQDYPLTVDLPYFRTNIDRDKKNLSTLTKQYFLPDDLYQKLLNFSRRSGYSIFNVLKVAWSSLVAKYSNQEKIVTNYPVNTRGKEYATIKGAFVNTLLYPYENSQTLNSILHKEKNNLFVRKKSLS